MKAGLVNIDAGNIAGGLFDLIDKLFTSDQERSEAKLKLVEMVQRGELAQIELNKVEAQHESRFVSGWRPFIGWVCGAAFAYTFILQPFLTFIAWAVAAAGGATIPVDTLPDLDLAMMMPVLGGMLGLGGLRTYEKKHGVNTARWETFMAAEPGQFAGKAPL